MTAEIVIAYACGYAPVAPDRAQSHLHRQRECSAALTAAQEMARGAQALHAGTLQKFALVEGEKDQHNQIQEPKKENWILRIFGRK